MSLMTDPRAAGLRVLVSHESSGITRSAFRARGFDAWSCDLLPADDGSPFHLQCDALTVYDRGWDLLIAHPDCTYLTAAGLHWNTRGRMVNGRPRAELTEEALEHVRAIMRAPIPRIAIENPRGCISTRIRPFDQTIQPYEFGEDASKQTDLWLHGLPLLVRDPAQRVPGRIVGVDKRGRPIERWANQTDSGQNRLGPSDDRWKLRAATYPGIARAWAQQWGDHLLASLTA
jgi:hypothetical protein